MSLFNIGDWFSGANTTGAQTQAEADANLAAQQAKLAADVAARNAAGIFQASDSTDLALANPAYNYTNSTTGAAAQGFVSGLGDGLANIKNSVTGFGPFKLVPAWVWVVGFGVLFWWVGGLDWIKGSLKKKS